jgi:hypothetical protein
MIGETLKRFSYMAALWLSISDHQVEPARAKLYKTQPRIAASVPAARCASTNAAQEAHTTLRKRLFPAQQATNLSQFR